MNQENIRPISTYDNLSARSAAATATTAAAAAASSNINTNSNTNTNTYSNSISNASQPKVQQLGSNTSATQPSGTIDNGISGNYQNATAETHQQQHNASSSDLNETRANNSIAAVRAALSDAKCKFFGINNYEYDALHPSAAAVSLSPSSDATTNSGCQAQGAKATSNYANVIDGSPISVSVLPEASGLQPMKTTTTATSSTFTPDRALPYGTTYEQIPLSDLDIPQPSQAVYMSTTVPQNIKGMKIAGRHTPTRNSLRHSRMIVVNNKTRHSIHESYSSHIRNLNLSRQLLIFQLAIGLLIVCLSVWILILAPNASILINPYLSGLSLLLASIAGLILLGRNRRSEYQRSYHNCYKVLLVESYVFCTLALIFCSLALVCAAIEFAEVNSSLASGDAACGPATSSLLNYRNCTCLTEIPTTESEAESEITTDNTGSQSTNESDSLNCQAIGGEWKYILGCSMALNTAGIVATFLYIMIYICCYRSSRKHFNTSI
ncbi:uncharacterized protein LOC133848948 [Drosophila sulfurigaster albostrigata]|uniref:uncharacterized protein LOC133848948 n=1 Tax=Drosophila sulfurigaster albostrigata TaxID=89887 RepID=UPI002D21A361|nr:uncharacterized protein LOC133848948 [Drosophila sulfurigaster albostrigata]